MEKKYLFFDIDGTLTDRTTGEIVPSAKETLERLEENGHFVAIATGRAHYKAEKFTKANGFKNMVCNGGNGLVIDEKLVMNIPLDKTNCIRIIEQADELGYGWCLVMEGRCCMVLFDWRRYLGGSRSYYSCGDWLYIGNRKRDCCTKNKDF